MKKLTKIATIFMAGTMMLSLAACGSSTSDAEETVNPVDKINIVNKDGEIVSGPALATEEPTSETEESTWRTLIPSTENVNLDDGSFTINGVTYTAGKTTLQDMIDAGAPLDEASLADAENQYEASKDPSSMEYGDFTVTLGSDDYIGYGEMIFTGNENTTTPEECVLRWVDFSPFTDYNCNPTTDDIIHYSFTVDGTTYEPSVMSRQDVLDKVSGAWDPWETYYNRTLEPEESNWHVCAGKTVEAGEYEVESKISFSVWNDTGATADASECLAVLSEIQMSVHY